MRHEVVPVDAEPARVQHGPGVRGDDGHAAGHGEIESEVRLLVDFVALVEVDAAIGEARFDL